MKLAVTLALVVCVAVPAIQLNAQERAASADGPVARAVSRESLRLAALDSISSSNAGEASRNRGKSNWAQVRDIEEGTEIIVAVRDSRRVWGHFLDADGASVTFSDAGSVPMRIARDDV